VGHRLERVNEAIKEVVSVVVAAELKDPRAGFVTVTGVETTPDLRHAKVYVTVLGKQAEREHALEALRASHGFIQARVAHEVRLKRTPQLEFVYDSTTDKALRISSLIDEYLQEHPTPPPAPGEEASVDETDGAPGEVPDGPAEDPEKRP
jgi:ribosome-binding factor A